MRYEFINPEKIPDVKDLKMGKKYSTRVVDVKYDGNGKLVIRLEYLGEEYEGDEIECLLPVIKDAVDPAGVETYYDHLNCIHCYSKSCTGNCRYSEYAHDDDSSYHETQGLADV